MTIEQAITRELSCALQAERLLKPRDHSMLHASSIGYCRRRQGFALMGTEEFPPDSHSLTIFDWGHAIHRQIQDRLVNVLKWCKPENIEVSLCNDEYRIKGTADAITEPMETCWGGERITTLVDRDCGYRYIIDIKSCTARPRLLSDPETGCIYGEECSTYDRLNNPFKHHLQQVYLYSWMVKQQWGLSYFPPVILLYVAKDAPGESGDHEDALIDLPYKVFVREVDEKILEETLKRAAYITDKVKKGLLPARDYFSSPGKIDWHCAVCPYRRACYPEIWGNEEPKITDATQRIIEEYANV